MGWLWNEQLKKESSLYDTGKTTILKLFGNESNNLLPSLKDSILKHF